MADLPIHLRTDDLYAYYIDLISRATQRIWLAAPYATRFAIAPLVSRLKAGSARRALDLSIEPHRHRRRFRRPLGPCRTRAEWDFSTIGERRAPREGMGYR